jgi:hypothetical protein
MGNGQVAIVEKQPVFRKMIILIKMMNSAPVETARAADDAVNFVALMKKKFGKIRAVLAGDSRDEGFFHV